MGCSKALPQSQLGRFIFSCTEVASGNPTNGSSHLQDVLKNISSYKVEFALKISYLLVFIISVILYSVTSFRAIL